MANGKWQTKFLRRKSKGELLYDKKRKEVKEMILTAEERGSGPDCGHLRRVVSPPKTKKGLFGVAFNKQVTPSGITNTHVVIKGSFADAGPSLLNGAQGIRQKYGSGKRTPMNRERVGGKRIN